jgi:hypothetical protein
MRTAFLVPALLASPVIAQTCTPGFQPGEPGASGISDSFSAYVQPMKDFQGKLHVGGAFSIAGTVATNIVASWNPATGAWSQLGGGVNLGSTNGFAAAMATYTLNGTERLYLGGSFANVRQIGGAAVGNTTSLAAWDGAQWSHVFTEWQPATGKSVWALLDWERAPGQRVLVAGGGWNVIGGSGADGIAYFDGSWHNVAGPLDTGIAGTFSPTVFALAVYNNQLYIGGRFDSVNGVAAPLIARWNGTTWQRPGALAAASVISDISSLHAFDDGTGAKLYAGGYDMRVGGQPTSVAAWNGVTWSRVGQNLGGRTTCMATYNDGGGPRLYAGWTADAQENYIYRLENNTWTVVDGGMDVALTGNFPSVFGMLTRPDGLYVGGNFQIAGGEPAYGIARYAGCPAACDSVDYNQDGIFPDTQDILDFLTCFGGGPCPNSDIDFNNDGLFPDTADIAALITAFAGGPCP